MNHSQIRKLLPTVCHVLIFLGILTDSPALSSKPPVSFSYHIPSSNSTISYPSFLYPNTFNHVSSTLQDVSSYSFIPYRIDTIRSMINDLTWLSDSAKNVLYQWIFTKSTLLLQSSNQSFPHGRFFILLLFHRWPFYSSCFISSCFSLSILTHSQNETAELPPQLYQFLKSPSLSLSQLDSLDLPNQSLLYSSLSFLHFIDTHSYSVDRLILQTI